MKVLIVCREHSGRIAPFIMEQANSLRLLGVDIDYFLVDRKGFFGYLKKRKNLLIKINLYQPDIIHAHYGLSGLLANLQRRVPVITTYHGSDINNAKVFLFSRLCMLLSVNNIFVSEKNRKKSGIVSKQSIIPCGVNMNLFILKEKEQARKELGLDNNIHYVLFSGEFQNLVKNAALAKKAVALLPDTELFELKGYSRKQVALLMNAVDATLMTSFTEGSPQFIKEAMACNCPIVSVPVGDVSEMIDNIGGCLIATYNAADVAEKLKKVFDFGKRTKARERILELGLDSETVAKKIMELYKKIII